MIVTPRACDCQSQKSLANCRDLIVDKTDFLFEGIGWWSLQAVQGRDLPVVSATALFSAVCLIVSNLIVDVVYSILDPRVRLS